MSYTITAECISCDRCRSQCPTNAIQITNGTLAIDSSLCNDCLGYSGVPLCTAGCPTNLGCIPSLTAVAQTVKTTTENTGTDYWDDWFTTYNRLLKRLKGSKQTQYWERWFEVYSQELKLLLSASSMGLKTEANAFS